MNGGGDPRQGETERDDDSVVAPANDASTIVFEPCDRGFECGRLRVPIDHAKPGAATLELAVKRRRATGRRLGSLHVNPGGPGGSAIDFLPSFAARAGVLAKHFDLVAVDPRGVGRSTPIDCHGQLGAFFAADPSPDDEAEWRQLNDVARAFAEECVQKHGALLPYLGTPNVARDMDLVRAALGDEQLHYLGYSYGTAIGSWYAELFPARVGAMVLDGAVDMQLSAVELARTQGIGFEDTLKTYFAWCDAQPSRCTWTRARPAADAFDDLVAAIERAPLAARLRPAGPGELIVGVVYTLYGDEAGWRSLSRALQEAVDGSGNMLVAFTDGYLRRRPDGTYPNMQEANQAVNCIDYPTPSVDALRSEVERFRDSAPIFGVSALTGLWICAHWPRGEPPPAPPTGRGAKPIVVIGTTGDPATPYAWAEALSAQLSSAVLLTYEGEGHTAFGRGDACLDGAVHAYFIEGKVPAAGIHCGQRALARELPMSFSRRALWR